VASLSAGVWRPWATWIYKSLTSYPLCLTEALLKSPKPISVWMTSTSVVYCELRCSIYLLERTEGSEHVAVLAARALHNSIAGVLFCANCVSWAHITTWLIVLYVLLYLGVDVMTESEKTIEASMWNSYLGLSTVILPIKFVLFMSWRLQTWPWCWILKLRMFIRSLILQTRPIRNVQ